MSIFKVGFQKVSTNEALVISGKRLGNPEKDKRIFHDEKSGRMIKIVRGGTEWVPPYQTAEKIPLNSIQIKLSTPEIYTKDGVPVLVFATTTVKIADDLAAIANYAEQFLGKKPEQIAHELKQVLEGNLRAIVAKLEILEVNNQREKFITQVKEIAEPELANMGFAITSMVIDDVKDARENGFLVNLGRKKIADTRRDAEIAESNAALEVANKLAENKRAQSLTTNKAAVEMNESTRNRQLKENENHEALEQAKAATEQALQVKQTELDKALKIAQIEARKVEQEGTLAIKETERQVKEKEALILAQDEKIKAQALADIEVINAEAEAKVYEANALAKANAVSAAGKAEADAIRLKGLAEAETIAKKAEAMEKYGQAALLEMLVGVMPQMAEAIAKPLSAISEVKVMDFGGNGSESGVQSVASNAIGVLGLVQEAMKQTTGIDMKELITTNAAAGRNYLTKDQLAAVIGEETALTNEATGDLNDDSMKEDVNLSGTY